MSDLSRLGRTTACMAAALAVMAVITPTASEAQGWKNVTSARQLFDREPHEVQIRYGVGELRVVPADAPMLYEMEMRYDERYFTPIADYDSDTRRLRLGVEGRERRNVRMDEGSRAAISLSRQVPMDLTLQFGAGEAELELGGISLRSLSVSTGASDTKIRFSQPNPIEAGRLSLEAGAASLEVAGIANARARDVSFQGGVGATTLDFSGDWEQDLSASVKIGVGSVVLRIPRGVGVRVSRSSFLSSFDSQGLVKRGSDFFSTDWETAARKLELDINAAFGSVAIEWIN